MNNDPDDGLAAAEELVRLCTRAHDYAMEFVAIALTVVGLCLPALPFLIMYDWWLLLQIN